MFTQCAGLEQENQIDPVVIAAILPGVVETPMQKKLRSAEETAFPAKSRFENLKKQSLLFEPAKVAHTIVNLIEKGSLQTGQILDIRDLK